MDSRDIIIGEIQNSVAQLLGRSAGALMRKAGLSASEKLWPELPSDQSIADAASIMQEGVASLGGFGNFSITSHDDHTVFIEFNDCYFAGLTEDSGMPCGKQPICYFGFGLVERTLQRLTGRRTRVELVKRDNVCKTCFETATMR